jgi:hypothetical protein
MFTEVRKVKVSKMRVCQIESLNRPRVFTKFCVRINQIEVRKSSEQNYLCLSVYLFFVSFYVCLPFLPVCIVVSLSVSLSVYLFCLSDCCFFVCLSTFLGSMSCCFFVNLPNCLPVLWFFYLSVKLYCLSFTYCLLLL